MAKKIVFVLVFMTIISGLSLTNPRDEQYLSRIAADYTGAHHEPGAIVQNAILAQIGNSKRTSYFLFSTFRYELGNIGIVYVGIANRVFYIRSFTKPIGGSKEPVLADLIIE